MLKNIIFDVGGVLLDYRWKEMLRDYGLSEEEALYLGGQLFEDPLWAKLDLANVPDEEIVREFQHKVPKYKDVIEWFITHGEFMHVARPQVWERVHRLKEMGYHLYLLSNYSENLFTKHTKDASFMEDIDGKVVSYMIHQTKPSKEIYAYLLNKYELNPKESIFFDDRRENTEAAEKMGIKSYTVTSEKYLLEQLDEILSGKESQC
ncbi:MAG: HAD family phosphatase [Lachnospiraceae bacterium]|nr:HAD family phosphatase [Lachnospiraceae bacterium]MDD6191733.1 HAD family phosphatase [Lachnospiraceae bacterium]MDY4793151.1 HAD family phosphatase [Pararoseburia sp.]